MVHFIKALPQMILAPVLVLGAVALVLYLLGIAPDYIQSPDSGPRDYATIEEAEDVLGFDIALPSYFPSYLAWPPARTHGQREPFPMVETLFVSQGDFETMIIQQIGSDSDDLPVPVPWLDTVEQKTAVAIGDAAGVMLVGTRADGQPVNGVYWKSKGFYFIVVTSRSARELLTIARSI